MQAWTALPNGSCTAATSGRMRRGVGAPKRLGRELHVLGEAAVLADADDLVVGADVGVADAALVAGAADDVALGRDDVADLEAVGAPRVGADRDDVARGARGR